MPWVMGSRALRTDRRTRRIAALLAAVVAVTLLVTVSADPVSAGPTSEEFELCLLEKINASRAEVGAIPLQMAWDRNELVRGWSEWMRHNDFRHMNNAERSPMLPDGTYTWGENIAWTSNRWLSDCTQIHEMFMSSPGHRANILSANKRFAALGAYTDSSGWWVTELFFSSRSYDPGCDGTFCDDDTSTFEADIELLAAEGITSGCNSTGTRFCPKDYVTRGQMAAFLVRLLGLTDRGSMDFVDDDGSTFEVDIEKLAAAGITRGCNPPANTKFCPNDRVTRETMAAFLVRAMPLLDS